MISTNESTAWLYLTLLERAAEAPVRPLARPSPAPAARTGTAAPAVRTVSTPPGEAASIISIWGNWEICSKNLTFFGNLRNWGRNVGKFGNYL